jgi:hypothetical protein
MPNDRKKAAKETARVKRSGKRLVTASQRKADKAGKTFSASGGRKYAKHKAKVQTAANLEKEGAKRLATGKKTKKRSELKVTTRSMKKTEAAKYPAMQPKLGPTKREVRKRNKPIKRKR